jgi:hypothetical protein
MARSTVRPWTALWAVTAVVAVVLLAAGPASAGPASPSSALSPGTASPGTAQCQAGDLRISVPAAVPGDPAEGMGEQAWNLLFRNIASTACSLQGWPRLLVRTTAGTSVATRISEVRFSNLALVPDARIVLGPGQSAVVTAMSQTSPSGCVTGWTLGLTLPRAARPVTVGEPAGSFVPCVGGQLRLSPFYPEQTLTREIKALAVSAAPAPFPVSTAPEPTECTAAALRADVTSTVSQDTGSVIDLRLANTGGTCVLPGGWPTVRVQEAGDVSQVAKIFPDDAALQADRSLLTTYEHGTAQRTALTLVPGGSASIALLAARTAGQQCRRLTSATFYPSASLDAGRRISITAPVSICGSLQVLSFLPGSPGDVVPRITRGALAEVRAHPAEITHGGNTRFYYGTDSSAPDACGKGPYTEPRGDCSAGTAGPYGEYIGEVGSFQYWKGCTTNGLNWVQSNSDMANDNLVDYKTGLGAAAYWFAAGPGRDPDYNGTTSEASLWGEEQAKRAMSDISGDFFDFRYVFMDIENNGSPPDGNGWNTVWNGPCGNHVKSEYAAANLDYATYLGFEDYITDHSPYFAGVYSAGGLSYGSWSGIFGAEPVGNVAEWTFTNQQSVLSFPSGFSDSSVNAVWFGGAPAACNLMWQWSGGNGVLNGYGDFDQAEAANDANLSC